LPLIWPKLAKVPLVYVMSRGNRDQRPLPTIGELEAMGYKACIDAVTSLVVAFTAVKRAFEEIRATGKNLDLRTVLGEQRDSVARVSGGVELECSHPVRAPE